MHKILSWVEPEISGVPCTSIPGGNCTMGTMKGYVGAVPHIESSRSAPSELWFCAQTLTSLHQHWDIREEIPVSRALSYPGSSMLPGPNGICRGWVRPRDLCPCLCVHVCVREGLSCSGPPWRRRFFQYTHHFKPRPHCPWNYPRLRVSMTVPPSPQDCPRAHRRQIERVNTMTSLCFEPWDSRKCSSQWQGRKSLFTTHKLPSLPTPSPFLKRISLGLDTVSRLQQAIGWNQLSFGANNLSIWSSILSLVYCWKKRA